ncbi:MAG: hypothetical protein JKP90_10200 [Desulfofustis sp. PB-SRB1]|nr:hypothetical protein [Desulfofustis sp. PB-SRB1]
MIPASHKAIPAVDELTYQRVAPAEDAHGGELATVKMRYKPRGTGTVNADERGRGRSPF